MSKIVRYEFMGNWLFFWLLCISGIGIPVVILYLLNGTLRIESEMADPEHFLGQLQADLDLWLEDYNHSGPHSGKYCFGKTPMQPSWTPGSSPGIRFWIGRLRPLWPWPADLVYQIKF